MEEYKLDLDKYIKETYISNNFSTEAYGRVLNYCKRRKVPFNMISIDINGYNLFIDEDKIIKRIRVYK